MEEINPIQNDSSTAEPAADEKSLYRNASRRASFKVHVAIYVLVIAFLWIIWAFIFKGKEDQTFMTAILFLTIVWLVALIAHYLFVYKWNKSLIDKELNKLKKEIKRKEQELEKLRKDNSQPNA